MKSFLFSILFALSSAQHADQIEEYLLLRETPLDIKLDNIMNIVFDKDTMKPISCDKGFFLKFYSPWCPHCTAMGQAWIDFHQQEKANVHVGSIDCTSNDSSQICEVFSIQRYPTLVFCPPTKLSQDDQYTCKQFMGTERTADQFKMFYQTFKKQKNNYDVPNLNFTLQPQTSWFQEIENFLFGKHVQQKEETKEQKTEGKPVLSPDKKSENLIKNQIDTQDKQNLIEKKDETIKDSVQINDLSNTQIAIKESEEKAANQRESADIVEQQNKQISPQLEKNASASNTAIQNKLKAFSDKLQTPDKQAPNKEQFTQKVIDKQTGRAVEPQSEESQIIEAIKKTLSGNELKNFGLIPDSSPLDKKNQVNVIELNQKKPIGEGQVTYNNEQIIDDEYEEKDSSFIPMFFIGTIICLCTPLCFTFTCLRRRSLRSEFRQKNLSRLGENRDKISRQHAQKQKDQLNQIEVKLHKEQSNIIKPQQKQSNPSFIVKRQ